MANQILIAEYMIPPSDLKPELLGYIIGQDRYMNRDNFGIVYQIVVTPGNQRGFIGEALLKAQFDRSAYVCRLYCCWCAQDLEANKFWKSMGFVPLAHRNGSETKGKDGRPRVQIFWEKKIRGNEDTCNWWFTAMTQTGAMNVDRLALPIRPEVHWSEVEPIEIPMMGGEKLIDGPTEHRKRIIKPKAKIQLKPLMGGLRFASPVLTKSVETEIKQEKLKRVKKPKAKIDPKFIAASLELRDRYLEQVNEKGYWLESVGKYELTRDQSGNAPRPLPHGEEWKYKLLEAA